MYWQRLAQGSSIWNAKKIASKKQKAFFDKKRNPVVNLKGYENPLKSVSLLNKSSLYGSLYKYFPSKKTLKNYSFRISFKRLRIKFGEKVFWKNCPNLQINTPFIRNFSITKVLFNLVTLSWSALPNFCVKDPKSSRIFKNNRYWPTHSSVPPKYYTSLYKTCL